MNHQVSGSPLALKVEVVSSFGGLIDVTSLNVVNMVSDHTFIRQKYFTGHWTSSFDHNTWHPLRTMAKVFDVHRITNCTCSSIRLPYDSSSSVTLPCRFGAKHPIRSSVSTDSAALLDSSRSLTEELSCTAAGKGATVCGCSLQEF